MRRTLTWMLTVALAVCLWTMGCAADQPGRRARAISLRDLGEAYLVDGNHRGALRELLRAEEIDPKDPYTQNLLGLAYQASDRLDLAVRHFETALALKPDNSQARNNLAVVLLKQERWKEAIAHLQQLTEDLLYATPHYAATNLGYAYFKIGNLSPAAASYRKALEHYRDGFPRDPNYVRTLVGLGRVYLAQGNAGQALDPLKTAAGLAPNHPEIQFELGRAYAAVGDRANARHAFGKVRQLAPGSDLARASESAADRL